MDRRDFLRLLLASPLASPLLSSPGTNRVSSTLYLIADEPQEYLPMLVTELKERHIVRETRFSFRGPHPFAADIRTALGRRGWEYVSRGPSAALAFSYQTLRQPVPCSFTFIRQGRVWDLRTRALGTMWRQMNIHGGLSCLLTVATLSSPAPSLSPGNSAAVFIDGKKRETLSLKVRQDRHYRTLHGEVQVRVDGGKVEVLDSSCRHKICQSSAPAFLAGERIVCAPNHFLLAIEGPRFVDTVTG